MNEVCHIYAFFAFVVIFVLRLASRSRIILVFHHSFNANYLFYVPPGLTLKILRYAQAVYYSAASTYRFYDPDVVSTARNNLSVHQVGFRLWSFNTACLLRISFHHLAKSTSGSGYCQVLPLCALTLDSSRTFVPLTRIWLKTAPLFLALQ
jgi:hypothetical protein